MQTDIFHYRNPMPSSSGDGNLTVVKSAAVQANIAVQGWPSEAGSKALERYVALEDAAVVERLRAAGMFIAGNTNMAELSFGLKGDTAGRAVRENKVKVALVTDTMGEARVGAALAGLYGFKPSYGIVSRFGLNGLVPSMESIGVLAAHPAEIASVMHMISGSDDRDLSMIPAETPVSDTGEEVSPVVIGVLEESSDMLEGRELELFRDNVRRFKEQGFTIRELSLKNFDLFPVVHNIVGSVEASSSAGKYDGVRYGHRAVAAKNWNDMYLKSRAESFGSLVKAYLFQGAYFQFENYRAFENACRIRARLINDMELLGRDVDFIIAPTCRASHNPLAVTTVREVYDAFKLALWVNVTGQPSLHVPGSFFKDESNPGFQLVGPRLSDGRLLSIVARLSDAAEGGF